MSTHEGPPALQWSWPVFAGCGPSSAWVGRALLANACMQSPCSFPIPQTLNKSPDTCLVKCSPCSFPPMQQPPPSHPGPASQLTPVPAARVPELENQENGFRLSKEWLYVGGDMIQCIEEGFQGCKVSVGTLWEKHGN